MHAADAGGAAQGRPALVLIALAGALALNYFFVIPLARTAHEDFDAVHLYLPLAAGLAKSGLRFFLEEQSLQAPPFSYVYPWMLGMELYPIRLANALLSGVSLACVFRVAQLAHSTAAGLLAAWLFALCPLTRPYLSAPITEAPFILLGAIWIWALAEAWYRRRDGALVIAAIAISLAALTRATMFFGVVTVAGLAMLYALYEREPATRRLAWRTAWAHAGALALPLAFCLKNYLVFGFPFFATGGGNALYLGLSPLTGGYDPNYLGIEYDVGAIALGHHLTLKAEYLFRGVAGIIASEVPLPTLAANLARKLLAFLFVTNAQHEVLELRAWRVGLLLLAARGIWATRNPAMKCALGGMLAYQVAVHVPVLYTHRYSVGAIDLWLIIAAGIGLASFKLRTCWPLVALLVAGWVLGAAAFYRYGAPMPNVFGAARILIWQAPPGPVTISSGRPGIDIAVTQSKWFGWMLNSILVIDGAAGPIGHGCSELRISFRPQDGAAFSAPVVRHLGHEKPRSQYQIGATRMGLTAPGTLRLEAACAPGGEVSIGALRVYGALGAVDYRERLLGQPPQFPAER